MSSIFESSRPIARRLEEVDKTAEERILLAYMAQRKTLSPCQRDHDVALAADARNREQRNPEDGTESGSSFRCWSTLNAGTVAPGLSNLYGRMSPESVKHLLRERGHVERLTCAPLPSKICMHDDEQIKQQKRYARYLQLSEIVHGDWHALEDVIDLREPVRKRAEWELRLLQLRPYQEQIRHQVATQSIKLDGVPATVSTQSVRIEEHPRTGSSQRSFRQLHLNSSAANYPSVENSKIVKNCARQLLLRPAKEQMVRTRLDCVMDHLPKHFLNKKKSWKHLRESTKQIAVGATRCIEGIAARRDAIVERERKERMKLLKENDFGAYLELVKQSKNARIKELLNQTDLFLEGVSLKLVEEQRETVRAREAQRKAACLLDVKQSRDRVMTTAAAGEQVVDQPLKKKRRNNESTMTTAPSSTGTGLYRSVFQTEQSAEEGIQQPQCLVGGRLMPYQLTGLQFLVNLYCGDLSGILADEMGLGKTIQTIALLAYLKEVKGLEGPHLIIVPLSTLPNWMTEFERWCPSLSVIQFRGTKQERREWAHSLKRGSFNVCLTTYDWIIREKSTLSIPYWTFIIVDEGHRMKNFRSKFHITLAEFNSTHRLLLTGTPIQNNLSELWSLLNFLLPKIFTSASDFELWFEEPFKDFPGQVQQEAELTEEEKFLIINRLHAVLRPFLLRRVKEDVLIDLPEKREYTIRIQLSMWQKFAYEQLSKKALKLQNLDGKVSVRSFSNVMMQLRKIVNHPYLFEHEYYLNDNIWRVSGKFEVLDRMLPKLIHFKHKILIFCQMTQLMDILDDYLELKGFKRSRLDGSTVLDDRRDRMAHFNDPLSDTYVFTLSTRAGGLGLNLQAADTVIIFDSDWNPHQDLQAQARAHRLGQKNEVRVFRLVTVSGIEEAVLSKAQYKLDIDEKIIKAGMFNNRNTEEERQAKLRMLLYSKDMEKETRVTTPQELNRFMARSEEEEEFFQSHDEALFGAENFKSFEEHCCDGPMESQREAEPTSAAPIRSTRRGLRSQKPTANDDPDVSLAPSLASSQESSTIVSRAERAERWQRLPRKSRGDLVSPRGRKRRRQDTVTPVDSRVSLTTGDDRRSISPLKEEDPILLASNFSSSNSSSDLMTEEALLIKSNRLMSIDEIPLEWLSIQDSMEESQDKANVELQRSDRRARLMADTKVNPDTLSETAFLRALNRLESGAACDLHSALLVEKTKLESRTVTRKRGRPSKHHFEADGHQEIGARQEPIQEAGGEEDSETLRMREDGREDAKESDSHHSAASGDGPCLPCSPDTVSSRVQDAVESSSQHPPHSTRRRKAKNKK